jgi:hypothetical protein
MKVLLINCNRLTTLHQGMGNQMLAKKHFKNEHGAENDYYGKSYQNIGYSIGPSSKKATYINFSYTWLFIK